MTDWLAKMSSTPQMRGGTRCRICCDEDLLEGVTVIAEAIAVGKLPGYSFAHIGRVVSSATGKSIKGSDVIRHLNAHQPDLASRLRSSRD